MRPLLGGLTVGHRVVGPAPTAPLGEVQIGVGELHLGLGRTPTTPVQADGLGVDSGGVLVVLRLGRPGRRALEQLTVDHLGPLGIRGVGLDLGGHGRGGALVDGGDGLGRLALPGLHDGRDLGGDLLGGLVSSRCRAATLLHGPAHGLTASAGGLAAQGLLEQMPPGLGVEQFRVGGARAARQAEERLLGLRLDRIGGGAAATRHEAPGAPRIQRARLSQCVTGAADGIARPDEHRREDEQPDHHQQNDQQ